MWSSGLSTYLSCETQLPASVYTWLLAPEPLLSGCFPLRKLLRKSYLRTLLRRSHFQMVNQRPRIGHWLPKPHDRWGAVAPAQSAEHSAPSACSLRARPLTKALADEQDAIQSSPLSISKTLGTSLECLILSFSHLSVEIIVFALRVMQDYCGNQWHNISASTCAKIGL